MTTLYPILDIRAIEQSALAALPSRTLMERAGLAAARCALGLLPSEKQYADVLVLAGPGNNGGDALEVAAHLANDGAQVSILHYGQPDQLPEDAAAALKRAQLSPAHFRDTATEAALALAQNTDWSLVIDGLFGLGLSKPIAGDLHTLIQAINQMECPIVALDVPSGLNADTGTVVGQDGIAIRASHTITFIAGKPGLYTLHGRDHAGLVAVAPLAIDETHYPAAHCWLNDATLFSHMLKPRRHESHKGTYGEVAIVGGARGMSGAPILAARAALHSGAGRVFAVFLENAPAYDSVQPELMCRSAQDFDLASAIPVAGPGLGQSRAAHDWLAQVLNTRQPIVLDADALNLVAAEEGLQQRLKNRREPTLITPHPLEAGRLLGITSAEVQADRLNAARRLAKTYGATVILKGSGSIIAEPDGNAWINTTGNPALATAGTGDVLAGLCGAMLAQAWPVRETALAATWLHGAAADELAANNVGPVGMTAGELIPAVRKTLNRLTAEFNLYPPEKFMPLTHL